MQISIICNGLETNVNDFGALVSHTGWGMPDIDSWSVRSPGQHGDTWGGFSLTPRIGSLIFKMPISIDPQLETMYLLRQQLINLFSPLNSLILKFTTNSGVRCFDVHYYGGLGLDWDVSDWAAQAFIVQLKANDPTCYDPAGASWTFALGGGGDTFTVPYTVPYKMGASSINESQAINYPGSWSSYPFIRITGPITNPVITNLGTNEKIDFTGTTISAGDYYDIDTRFGLKTINDSSGVNQISKLNPSSPSQLNTFHIGASPEVPGGINSINVSGTAISSASKVDLSYFNRHLGQ